MLRLLSHCHIKRGVEYTEVLQQTSSLESPRKAKTCKASVCCFEIFHSDRYRVEFMVISTVPFVMQVFNILGLINT